MRMLCLVFPANKRALEATEAEQLRKVIEEYGEFIDAAVFDQGDQLEEALDLMIALDGWLDKQPERLVRKAVRKILKKGRKRRDWKVA